jgi:ubiquinone/menaquinone biosynthesis C-methylase UbiE
MTGYYHYFPFGLSSYIDGLLVRVREEVFQVFMTALQPHPGDSILDVGASADDHDSSNHFEKRYPHISRVCALGIDHLPTLIRQFPGLAVVQADARALPFAGRSFDFVYSHAVIEHVGSRQQQAMFLEEALRVARKGVLLTTPNRWHPIEFHTGLPFLHYLPSAVCRRIYRVLGKAMYASEETLNLLTSREMRQLLNCLRLPGVKSTVHRVRWLGTISNLILVIRKD